MKSVLFPLLAVSCFLPAVAAEKLAPGSPAPALVSGEFVQGDAVKKFESGKVYLVEFWATWCGPCVAGIPHLNDLHKKFADKGLVVIGQNVWEKDDSKVKPFVAKMGEKMTYRVALDDKSDGGKGRMAETWMAAADQSGIPAAFLVDKKGAIAWIGHPARIDDELIGKLLDGTFDAAAQAELEKKQEAAESATQQTFAKFKKALEEKNIDEANQSVDELAASGDPRMKFYIPMMRLDVAVASGNGKLVNEHAATLSDHLGKMEDKSQAAFIMTQFANRLSTAEGVKDLDPTAAIRLAEQASTLTEGKNAVILHTLARAKFVAGDKEGAVVSEEAAIRNASDDKMKAKMEETLASYKEGRMPEAKGK